MLTQEILDAKLEMERLFKILNVARQRVISLLTDSEMGGRHGGLAVIIYDRRHLLPHGPRIIGALPDSKREEKLNYATEKLVRVLLMSLHASSETRKEELGRFGGAVSTRRYVFSVSGLIEEADEAIGHLTAVWGVPPEPRPWPIEMWRNENPIFARIPPEELVFREDLIVAKPSAISTRL